MENQYAYREEYHSIDHHCLELQQNNSFVQRNNAQNFQNRSSTELCTPSFVWIVSTLFAINKRIGHIQMVRRATRITGASDVIADAVFGWALRNFCNGLMKPEMLFRLVNAQSSDTGKICIT